MDAGIFFELKAAQAIPLYCMSSQQWDEEGGSFALAARNYFSLRQFSGRLGDYCCIHNAIIFAVMPKSNLMPEFVKQGGFYILR